MSTSILTSSQGSLKTAVVSAVGDTGSADYCIFFGAFAGAVFYVATAAYMKVIRRDAYFLVSWIVGVYGAGLVGTKLEKILGFSDQSLDGLGAV
ncbi:phage holin family protein, partial [Erwinia amylovora]|uniref:putative holin n=1 Tax=Erwinia amylovora TaxID=552 RepID=UPI0020C053B4